MEYIAAEDSDARVLNPVALKCAGNNCCDLFFTTAQLMEDFPRVFDGHIRTMPGEEFHIRLREDARLFCVTTPRSVHLSLRD